jgi:hypothetical protein
VPSTTPLRSSLPTHPPSASGATPFSTAAAIAAFPPPGPALAATPSTTSPSLPSASASSAPPARPHPTPSRTSTDAASVVHAPAKAELTTPTHDPSSEGRKGRRRGHTKVCVEG